MKTKGTLPSSSTIYHYTTASVAFEYILPYGQLKFNTLQNTNDPFEYKMLLVGARYWGETMPKEVDKGIRDARQKIHIARNTKCQVACFSFNLDFSTENFNDTRRFGCSRSRMWSEYGDGHRGLVLVFDRDKLNSELTSYFETPWTKIKSREIIYKNIGLEVRGQIDGNEIERKGVEKYCSSYIHENADELFFTKDSDYRDENEYRFVLLDEERPFYLKFKDSFKGIIIGDRFPDGHFPNLKYYTELYNIPCQRLHWENGVPLLLNPIPESPVFKGDIELVRINNPEF